MKFWWILDPTKSGQMDGALNHSLKHSRRMVWVMAAGVIVFIAWASFARLDEITRAQGSVIASSRTQVIQSQDGGVIEAILVKEGEVVEANQVLARLETTRAETSYLDAKARYAGLSATAARLSAEIFGGSPRFPAMLNEYPEFRQNQLDLLRKRRAAFTEDIQASESVLALVQQELGMLEPLLATGDVSRTEVLRLQRQVADLQAQITNRKNRYFQDVQAELNKVEEELLSVEQSLTSRKWQLENTLMKSPMKGVVKNIRVTTRGGVLRPGEELMQIVPLEDDLVIEAKLKPKDIAYVHIGQDVSVKVDAYDASVYGTLPGKLTYISPDTITDETSRVADQQGFYRVRVTATGRRFSGRPDQDLEIQPGMTSTIEIKTGSKSVLAYIFKPVTKTMGDALTER